MPHFSRTPPLTRSFLLLLLRSVRRPPPPQCQSTPRPSDGSRQRRFFLSRRLRERVRARVPVSACGPPSAARVRAAGVQATPTLLATNRARSERLQWPRNRWARWSLSRNYRLRGREPSTAKERSNESRQSDLARPRVSRRIESKRDRGQKSE